MKYSILLDNADGAPANNAQRASLTQWIEEMEILLHGSDLTPE